MGYYVETTSVDFRIPATQVPNAFAALCHMNSPVFDDQKHGGSWGGGAKGKTAAWYSWMPADYHLTCKSLKDIFEALGFEGCKEDGLGFTLGNYDSKTGQQELFLAVAAQYALPGMIEWTGEDGSRWASLFELGKMTTKDRTSLVWDEDAETYV